MSRPEQKQDLFRCSLPDELTDGGEPIFAEPWQAQAFAMTVTLYDRGLFSWPEWAEAFSSMRAQRPANEDEQVTRDYYEDWLAALETLVSKRSAIRAADLGELKEQWEQAYRSTPHGEKVSL